MRFDLEGEKSLMGPASGFFVIGATSKGYRLSFLGMKKKPAPSSLFKLLEAAAKSVKRP